MLLWTLLRPNYPVLTQKMVSLMSDEYLESNMKKMSAETKKILISKLQNDLNEDKEDTEDRYGNNWKIKIKYIDSYRIDEDTIGVSISVKYKGKGGLLGLSDREDTEEITIKLTRQKGKWKICDWD